MFPAKRGMSSGLTMPFLIISAKPEMEVRGVFSSWETLAVNSRRRFSRSSRSVMSRITTTAPSTSPSRRTGLAITWQQRPPWRTSCSLRLPAKAPSTALRNPALRLRAKALTWLSAGTASAPSSRRALVL